MSNDSQKQVVELMDLWVKNTGKTLYPVTRKSILEYYPDGFPHPNSDTFGNSVLEQFHIAQQVAYAILGKVTELNSEVEELAATPEMATERVNASRLPRNDHALNRTKLVVKSIRQGYTGNSCRHCGSMSMVQSGTCEKCNDCGETSGCS